LIAGVAVLAAVVALVVPQVGAGNGGGRGIPAGASSLAGAPGAGSTAGLGGSMRDNADRLFNRVMAAREQGDTASAKFFVPMAVQAYQAAGDLDADGLYHLSLLQVLAGDARAGLETAEQILATSPDHLLGLAAAAEAAEAAGEPDAARRYWAHLARVYVIEEAKALQEYLDHQAILPEYLARARKAAGS